MSRTLLSHICWSIYRRKAINASPHILDALLQTFPSLNFSEEKSNLDIGRVYIGWVGHHNFPRRINNINQKNELGYVWTTRNPISMAAPALPHTDLRLCACRFPLSTRKVFCVWHILTFSLHTVTMIDFQSFAITPRSPEPHCFHQSVSLFNLLSFFHTNWSNTCRSTKHLH